jgi:hypothetical protein
MKPDRPIGGSIIPSEHGWNPFGIFQPSFGQMYQINQARQAQNAEAYDPSGGYAGFESTMDFAGPKANRFKGKQTEADRMKAAQHENRKQEEANAAFSKAVGLGPADQRGRPLESDIMRTQQGARAWKREDDRQKSVDAQKAAHEDAREREGRPMTDEEATAARTKHARDFERQAKYYNPAQRAGTEPREPGSGGGDQSMLP